MTVTRTAVFESAAPARDLTFVLHSLGHDCPLGCGRASDELGAIVWATHAGLPDHERDTPHLVVVDSSASLAPSNRSHHLVRYLDRCARTDGVRVRERRASDAESTLIPL